MEYSALAIDLGGSSGRAILGTIKNGQLSMKEIHRFPNIPIVKGEYLHWDLERIINEIIYSIQLAYSQENKLESIGVDTWGVDFGVIKGTVVNNPICYRDSYSVDIFNKLTRNDSLELYKRTGIQLLPINTLFQLMAQKEQGLLTGAEKILLMPDLINYLLTGKMKSELSIASTTQLLNSEKNDWDWTLIESLNLPKTLFPEIVRAGEVLGKMNLSSLKHPIKVIHVGAHDTASAIYSIPDLGKNWFISSGTWSLLGFQNEHSDTSGLAEKLQISNEKGVDGNTLRLKNLTGLWLIEEARRYYEKVGKVYSYTDIAELLKINERVDNSCLFDTDYSIFLQVGHIPEKIRWYAKRTNQNVPGTPRDIFKSIYESLALKYKETIEDMQSLNRLIKERQKLFIIGGGSQSEILCQYTANALEINIEAGLSEATVIGNLMVQFENLTGYSKTDMKTIFNSHCNFKQYRPIDTNIWEEKYREYKLIKVRIENELSENWHSSNDRW